MYPPRTDAWVGNILRCLSAIACLLVVLVFGFLWVDSLPALRSLGLRLVTDPSWHPDASAQQGTFGIVPIVVGTVLVTVGAVLLAAPVGLASALFCNFYASRGIAVVHRRMIEVLAGIPSVVYGFWGLVVLVPLIARLHPPGASLLAGILVVALMILPTMMLVFSASLAAVPQSYFTAAAALGMGRWSTLRSVAIPSARAGMMTGILLGAARAMGETMAVVMVCGNVVKVPRGLFDPVRTLTSNIALEMGYALGEHRSALFASGLILLLMAIAMTAAIEMAGRGRAGEPLSQ